MTDQNYIKGSVPTMHVAYDYLTNRQTGEAADANGNLGSGYVYDVDNRLVQVPGNIVYAYDAGNKRVWSYANLNEQITFWAGQKLATYSLTVDGLGVWFTLTSTNVNFGGKLVSKGAYNSSGTGDKVSLTPVAADRLGSIGKFYPYGVERPSATANDKEKFTGYFRDASTGLDYADQRYEQPGGGRFMTPDSAASAKASDPESWNRYAYVGGDPVNQVDPTGQDIGYFGGGYDVGLPDYDGGYYSCDYYCSAGIAAANYWLNLYYSYLTNQYNADVSLLQPLQDQYLISGYSVDFWTGSATIQLSDYGNSLLQNCGCPDLGQLLQGLIIHAGTSLVIAETEALQLLKNIFVSASSVRGLPPDGVVPPVADPGSLQVGPASRPREAAKGGESLWDKEGGEWRYYPGDKYHNPHWDYNPHDVPNSGWQNIPIGGLPTTK